MGETLAEAGPAAAPAGIRPILTGHRSLIVGIANEHSIAYGCAKAFRTAGAELAITWLNDKARPYVEPLAQELGAPITAALDVSVPGELEAVFEAIRQRWGRLDSLVHSIAFAQQREFVERAQVGLVVDDEHLRGSGRTVGHEAAIVSNEALPARGLGSGRKAM